MGCQSRTVSFVSLLVVNVREEGVMALNLPIGPLKSSSGLEPVPERVFKGPMGRCKATTPSSLS